MALIYFSRPDFDLLFPSINIRKKLNLKRNRYEFQTDHRLRKWFKTRCEISGMKSINIEILMGHSIGISDSYYNITGGE